jgi:hypothetical protein
MLGAGSTITPLPSTFRKGFAVAQFEPEALADNSTLAGVKEMALAGATWVEVEPLVTQAHLNSSDPGPSPDTTTDAALVTFIQYAQSVGLQVVMKMLLTIDDGASWVYASPTNATGWFQAYGAVLVHYARLGEAQGAQGLCLGTELAHLSIHQECVVLVRPGQSRACFMHGCWLAAGWLLAAGCWLLVVGCWLLLAGCWLLVAGCWMLVAVG